MFSENSISEQLLIYKSALKFASEGIVIVNQDGQIEFLNHVTEKMFGYSRDELLHQSVEILLPHPIWKLHREQPDRFLHELQSRPMSRGNNIVALSKNGKSFPVEFNLSYVETGRGIYIPAFITDISERKEAETQLRIEQEKAQKYLDVAEVMLVAVNLEGKITLINQKGCKILGYNENELIGEDWFDTCVPQNSRKKLREMFRTFIKGDVVQSEYFENPVITKAGEERLIAWHKIVLRDESGKSTGTLSSGEDITERKNAEELAKKQQQQIMQADKMASIGILVSGVAHEINNPNNYILLNSKIISKVWEDIQPILQKYYAENGDFALAGLPYTSAREKIGKLISGVSEGAVRIQKIVQSLKDFAKQDRGELDEEVNVNAVVDSAILIVHNLINKSTNRFELEFGKNIPLIRGNSQQLEQVIINLITNACQALEKKDNALKVSTSFYEEMKGVRIRVSDEGVGIPPENMKYILDPFFTTKRDSGGTGLGIPVSYNIIKNHGGKLDFFSKPGEGTTVTIFLPVD